MKKQIITFVKSLGGVTKYSGSKRIMFMPEELHDAVLAKFGYGIPFTLGILEQ